MAGNFARETPGSANEGQTASSYLHVAQVFWREKCSLLTRGVFRHNRQTMMRARRSGMESGGEKR